MVQRREDTDRPHVVAGAPAVQNDRHAPRRDVRDVRRREETEQLQALLEEELQQRLLVVPPPPPPPRSHTLPAHDMP